MSPFFDDLEAQLRSAARAQAGTPAGARDPRPARPRWWAWRNAAPVVAAVVVAVIVVGGALVLLGHRGHAGQSPSASPPPHGGIGAIIAHTPKRQLHRELAYMNAATHRTLQSPACRVHAPQGVSFIHGSPGPDLLSVLGVLRRPATPADRLDPGVLAGTPDVYSGHTRLAFRAGGVSYYIVPARNDPTAWMPSDRCFDLQVAALNRYLPNIPESLREPTRVLQAGLIAFDRRMAANAPRDTICLVESSGNSSSSSCGIGPAQIKRGVPGGVDQGKTTGVVPDGVASVTFSFRAAAGYPARSVTAPVRGNVYAARVKGPGVQPVRMIVWRSAQGRVIKRISELEPASKGTYCQHHPMPCLLVQGGTAEQSSSSSTASSDGWTAYAPLQTPP